MRRRPLLFVVSAVVLVIPLTSSAQLSPTREQAAVALRRACEFFRNKVSASGGYLWRYSADLKQRAGETAASATTIWVQPPGTPSVGEAFLTAYEATGDDYYLQLAKDAAMALVQGQLRSGGWDYRVEFDPSERARYNYRTGPENARARNVSTLDDETSQAALSFLMRIDQTLQQKDTTIHEAVAYAIDKLLAAQYPNGAWPQRFDAPPDPAVFPVKKASYPESWPREWPNERYYSYYTFNDDTLADMIDTMFLAAEIYGDDRCWAAAEKAGDFILLAQMHEPQPAWAQQYDAEMHPAWARKFEPASITGGESQGAIRILLRIYRETGKEKYLEPIPRAIAYLEKSRLPNGQLARFYELQTNRPLFFTKDYRLTYSDEDVPTHYAFKISYNSRLAQDYERARSQPWSKPVKQEQRRPARASETVIAQAQAAIKSLDAEGRWLSQGRITDEGGNPTSGPVIDCRTFIRNVVALSAYLRAVSTAQ
ncbi:MAG: hypothetical protein HY000_34575 [Planctomycetes bacterium]|nr:hypothetical protein [Planctomycetota bacterium]